MLLTWFIKHQWRQTFRSTIFQRNLAVNIFLGFIILLLFLEFLIGGIYLSDKWHEIFPDEHPVSKFNSYLFYFFAMDFVMRFFMQSLPVLSIEPYLHLPIRKSSIINYLLGKALLSFFNFYPFLVFIPFAVFQVKSNYSVEQAWMWIVSLFAAVLFMNYLLVYMKRQLANKPKIVAFFGLFIGLLLILDRFEIFSFSKISMLTFDAICQNPIYFLIPILLLILMYAINFRFLAKNMYPEEISVKRKQRIDHISDIKYIKSLGRLGELISLEFRLFLRHKRTKSLLYIGSLLLFYGLIFYPQPEYSDKPWIFILVGWFVTGVLIFNYLNYAFSYESNYFDALLAHNIDMQEYFKMKIKLAMIIGTIFFVLSTPYVYFGADILLVNFCVYIYNIGFMSYLLLYIATYNKNHMDLSKGAAFNYQGVGASNWLAMLPCILIPILVFVSFNAFGLKYIGIISIALIGILGMLFNKSIMNILLKQFEKRKYIMAEGFRKK